MKRAVHWSTDALRGLDAATAYIAARNPTAARRVIAELRSAGDRLGQSAIDRSGRVVILRVIHTARDWPRGQWPK